MSNYPVANITTIPLSSTSIDNNQSSPQRSFHQEFIAIYSAEQKAAENKYNFKKTIGYILIFLTIITFLFIMPITSFILYKKNIILLKNIYLKKD